MNIKAGEGLGEAGADTPAGAEANEVARRTSRRTTRCSSRSLRADGSDAADRSGCAQGVGELEERTWRVEAADADRSAMPSREP
jgi:hypothetical protein